MKHYKHNTTETANVDNKYIVGPQGWQKEQLTN